MHSGFYFEVAPEYTFTPFSTKLAPVVVWMLLAFPPSKHRLSKLVPSKKTGSSEARELNQLITGTGTSTELAQGSFCLKMGVLVSVVSDDDDLLCCSLLSSIDCDTAKAKYVYRTH